VAGRPKPKKRSIEAREATVQDGRNANLVDDDARLRLEADGRDDAADERDTAADERDRRAVARDEHAEVRDDAMGDQPDIGGTRRFAEQDRRASAEDREEAGQDRRRASDDRTASSYDRSVAEQIKAQLLVALDDAEKVPETTLVIGQAQGMLMATFGGNAAEAMIEIGDRADRDQVGLQEAARRILADGAPSGIPGIRVREL
jgi:hypothetical protein